MWLRDQKIAILTRILYSNIQEMIRNDQETTFSTTIFLVFIPGWYTGFSYKDPLYKNHFQFCKKDLKEEESGRVVFSETVSNSFSPKTPSTPFNNNRDLGLGTV